MIVAGKEILEKLRALNRHWDAKTPAEREEVLQRFGDALERRHLVRVLRYRTVQRYLAETGSHACKLMPGWPGWDVPHLWNFPTGNIVPLNHRSLLRAAWEWRCGRGHRWRDPK